MRNKRCITLKREAWTAPESFTFGDALLKPLAGGETLVWRVV
jgi:dihydroorotase